MSDLDIEVNEALDAYVAYINYDGPDDDHNGNLKWDFIERAVDALSKMTGRDVSDEINE